MKQLLRILGWIWAGPITLPCFLFYVGPFWALGWYRYVGRSDDALVWVLADAPAWLQRLWTRWGGQTVGNLVTLHRDPALIPQTLVHEKVHVRQCMTLGVLQPILYGACSLSALLVGEAPHKVNPFEIAARRAAGQDPFGA